MLCVDDHPLVRKGIASILANEADLQLVGEAGDGREAVEQVFLLEPDVALLDISMPSMNGLEAARHLKEQDPNAVILMVTADPTIQLQREAKKIGLNGFCPKDKASCLLTAIEALARGQPYFHFREPAEQWVANNRAFIGIIQRNDEKVRVRFIHNSCNV